MKCPGFQKLIDFLDGQLSDEEAQYMTKHLEDGCSTCVGDRTWYENLRSIVEDVQVFRPAPWVRKRAVELFERQQGMTNALVRATLPAARLIYDSLERLSFATARPAEAAGRQLIYQASGYNVDIQIAASGELGAEIMGQILREGETGFKSVTGLLVDLTKDREDVWSTTTNGFGEFKMHEVASGRYGLRIETEEAVITIEGLPVLQ